MNDEPREIRNKVFDADYDRKQKKSRSKKYERRAAKAIGGSRHAMSGAGERQKGDLSNELVVAEHKYTGKASLSLKREWLEKVSIEALAVGKTPAFAFTFTDWDDAKLVPKDWIAMPASFFRELMERADG